MLAIDKTKLTLKSAITPKIINTEYFFRMRFLPVAAGSEGV